jgi:hypothetical protein
MRASALRASKYVWAKILVGRLAGGCGPRNVRSESHAVLLRTLVTRRAPPVANRSHAHEALATEYTASGCLQMPANFLRAYSWTPFTNFLRYTLARTRLCGFPRWPRAKPPLNLLDGGIRLRCDLIQGYALVVFLAGCLLAVKSDDSGFTRRHVDPGECLRGRVGLVGVLGVGEGNELVNVVGQPGRLARQEDEAVLDSCGLGAGGMTFSSSGLHPLTECNPSRTSSWISWVPEALSSIRTTVAP